MVSEEVYGRFIIKINKNAQTDNIQCDRGRFVEIYNEEKNKYVEWTLEKRNEDDVRYIQALLIPHETITSSKVNNDSQEFDLPELYFDLADVYAIASSDCCEKQKIDLYEIKAENISLELQDESSKPSFDYRESLYQIASDKVVVYKNDFTIDNINLSYYRYPVEIELQDVEDPESGFKAGIEFLLDDKAIDRIISMCAASFDLNNDNQKFQADKQRVVSKF